MQYKIQRIILFLHILLELGRCIDQVNMQKLILIKCIKSRKSKKKNPNG